MKEIDYDRYWSDAWAAARQARDNIPDVARDARLARWPKVFIYELTDALNESFRPDAASTKDVFGSALRWDDAAFRSSVHRKDSDHWWKRINATRRAVLSANVRDTNHYGFTKALVYRLWKSPRYRTRDPAAADIFVVAVFPLPKRGRVINELCDRLSSEEVQKALPHLNEANAHKHMLIQTGLMTHRDMFNILTLRLSVKFRARTSRQSAAPTKNTHTHQGRP